MLDCFVTSSQNPYVALHKYVNPCIATGLRPVLSCQAFTKLSLQQSLSNTLSPGQSSSPSLHSGWVDLFKYGSQVDFEISVSQSGQIECIRINEFFCRDFKACTKDSYNLYVVIRT